ncbi:MAG: sulfotransferase [Rhodospirillales bacterium]
MPGTSRARLNPASHPHARPKVILLAGFPNSGTTIAAYILGQHPKVFASGELTQFPGRQLKPSKVCSCGQPAMQCPFWCEVLDRLGDLRHAADAVKMPALYRIICDVSGADVVVDVAHDLRAVRAARALPGIDLRLVHLSRPALAVLRSRLALNCRQGDVKPYTLTYAWRALNHTRRLHIYEWVLGWCVRAEGTQQAMRASYEELCNEPASPLAQIGHITGLDFSDVVNRLQAGAPLEVPTHMIRGNARLRSEASVHLAAR